MNNFIAIWEDAMSWFNSKTATEREKIAREANKICNETNCTAAMAIVILYKLNNQEEM
jgi:hypothetical protein